MADALRIETYGLRDLLGRFARSGAQGLQERQDALLRDLAQEAKEHLAQRAPRGAGPGPHLADQFEVAALQRDGASATISVSNAKMVHSTAGKGWALLRLITTGTAPHDIPNAFGWGHSAGIGGRFDGKWHPGTHQNPFVAHVVSDLQPQRALMRTARGVLADLAGGGP